MEAPQNNRRYNIWDGENFLASILLYDATDAYKTEASILAMVNNKPEHHFTLLFSPKELDMSIVDAMLREAGIDKQNHKHFKVSRGATYQGCQNELI
jgi:hypothetical protein